MEKHSKQGRRACLISFVVPVVKKSSGESKIAIIAGSNIIYSDRGKSNPASTASPHYSFGKLNASMQIACQGKFPLRPLKKK